MDYLSSTRCKLFISLVFFLGLMDLKPMMADVKRTGAPFCRLFCADVFDLNVLAVVMLPCLEGHDE